MTDDKDDEVIELVPGRLIDIDFEMINLTGIPDDQFRSVDEDGNPVVETESMDHPLIDFDDLPLSTSDSPVDGGAPPGGQIPSPGANGTAPPPVPPGVPPKSV